MSSFDPITYAAVQRLKREVGEPILVADTFDTTVGTDFVETGKYYSSTTYPDLFAICKRKPGLLNPTEIPRTNNNVITSMASNGTVTIYTTGAYYNNNSNYGIGGYFQYSGLTNTQVLNSYNLTNAPINSATNGAQSADTNVYVTSDNTTWTPVAIASGFIPLAVGYLAAASTPVFIVVSFDVTQGFYTSPDGITWTQVAFPSNVVLPTHAGYTNQYFTRNVNDDTLGSFSYMIGMTNFNLEYNFAIRTVDGVNWDFVNISTTSPANNYSTPIFSFFNDDIVALATYAGNTTSPSSLLGNYIIGSRDGSGNYVIYNNLGVTTSAIDVLQASTAGSVVAIPFSVVSNGKIIVASLVDVNANATAITNLFYSQDGVNWNSCAFANNTNSYGHWRKVVWTGDYFIATSTATKNVVMSRDGINWGYYSLPAPYNKYPILSVFTSGSKDVFVVTGDSANSILMGDNVDKVFIENIPAPIPGTKYIVKASI